MSEQETHSDIVKALDSIGAPYGETLSDRIRARGAAYARGSASAMDAIAFARKERDGALAALDKMTARANAEEYRATLVTAEINAVRDALNDANIPYADTPAKRIREFDTAMAAVAAERDEVIRQRGEALGRVGATVAVLDETRWRETQQQSRAEAAEKREAEALAALNAAEDALTDAAITDAESLPDRIRELATRAAKYKGALVGATDEITALDRALSAAGLPTAETLSGRVAGLQLMRAEALSEARALTTERDNCREVLRKEREERAAEKAAMGAALQALRAENTKLTDQSTVRDAMIQRLLAQLEALERVILAGLRG